MTRLLDSHRLLVRMPSWLGDFVMAEPLVRELHARLAQGRLRGLSLCAPARFFALFEGGFEGVERIPLVRGEGEPRERWRGHDLALLLNGSWRSAWCALRAGIPERVSWSRGGRGALLTFAATPARERGARPLGIARIGRFPRWLPRPFGASCIELASWIGVFVREQRPRLTPTAMAVERAHASLSRVGISAGEAFVLVNGARRVDSAKALPAETLSNILRVLDTRDALPLVVHAAPGEDADARRAIEGTRVRLLEKPELDELLALISLARCYLTPDTGPRHLATAVDTPAVVLFGPTDPRHTADHLEQTRSLRLALDCSPCHRERCPLPAARNLACLRELEPEHVAAAVRAQIALATDS